MRTKELVSLRGKTAVLASDAGDRNGSPMGVPNSPEENSRETRKSSELESASCTRWQLFSEPQWQSIARLLGLSTREFEIVRAVFNDRKQAAIARELGISTHTVHTHLERLYRKLGVASRCQLMAHVFMTHLRSLSPHTAGAPTGDFYSI